jgi:hypothetical protein
LVARNLVARNLLWLLGICFLRGALEGAVEGIGDGEKGFFLFFVH